MSAGASKGHGPPRKRHHHDDDHGEAHADERWLVTYADMVTLLMVLFIVMFAMSTVDEKKYEQLKEGLAVGFGREDSILNGASPVSNSEGVNEPGEASYEMLLAQVPESQRETMTKVLQESDRLRNERASGEAKVEVDRLLKVWGRIDKALRKQGLRDDVRATIDDRGLVVSLVSEHVVFEPNVAELTERGRRVVDTLAPVLAELTEPVELDGHTNQEKVKPKYYPTDWELSLARAVHVLRRLEEVHGIRAGRLRATGFGHTKPLVDPARAGSQKVNKRVDIVVLSQAPAETRALMSDAYDEIRREAGLDDPDTSAADRRTGEAGPTAAGRPATTREELP
ncbi:flagellar motor protein MotB [Nocardioides aromaticivorans]|uniref:Flagellar motor protein MotB n=1 Tax=Nocardioides aromaticivorans TaxID=200618 RepID=A0ABX7PGC8_9ACTN|nr:flagellar motor protein MotB [Nocardioides aromaticivorans]QSR25023.1 flagellar motor protein MotB [Nocardioides aromaticivorans]